MQCKLHKFGEYSCQLQTIFAKINSDEDFDFVLFTYSTLPCIVEIRYYRYHHIINSILLYYLQEWQLFTDV